MTDMSQQANEGNNEVSVRQADLKEFAEDIEQLAGMVAVLEAAKDNLSERCRELAEKYEEHPSLSFKAAQIKRMANILFKDNLAEEREKVEQIFDVIEAIQEK